MQPRIVMLDPNSHSLPYDLALAEALTDAGASVEVIASRFLYAPNGATQSPLLQERFFAVTASRPAHWLALSEWPQLRRTVKALSYPFDWVGLLGSLARQRPDILHVQWSLQPSLERALWRLVRRMGVPIVYTAHDLLPHVASPADRARYGRLYRAADAVMVHTEARRSELTATFGVSPERVHVAPHGPLLLHEPEQPPAQARELLGLPAAAQVVLFAGLIEPYKGLADLVEAFVALANRHPAAHLVVVGRPNVSIAAVRARLAQAGLQPRVHIEPRFVPDATLAAYLCAADVVVLPYRATTTSGMLLAALRFGRPVVATRVGDLAEVIDDGHSGLLVPPGEPAALARALSTLLQDAAMRTRLGLAGRQLTLTRDSWPMAAQLTLAAYRTLLPSA